MKTFAGKLIALLISVVFVLGSFASCELLEVNTDRDMEQVVASVNVDGATAEDIYKRELVSGYVSYGYQYVQSYGYTVSATYELILNNLVNNKVIVQYSRQQLAAVNKTYTPATVELPEDKYVTDGMIKAYVDYVKELLKYVTEVQAAEAEYNVKANFVSMINSFDETTEEAEEKEDETITARTTPTAATVDGVAVDEEYVKATTGLEEGVTEEELSETQKAAYDAWKIAKYDAYNVSLTTAKKAAFNTLADNFATLGLFGKNEFENLKADGKQYDINNYCYYVYMLSSNLESFIINNYEEYLQSEAEKGITTDAMWSEYLSAYETQVASYKDLAAYETALDGVTEDSFILYNPTLGTGDSYGYVANILIGFTDEVTAALSNFKPFNSTAKNEYRTQLLKTLTAKDQRTTWIQNAYGDMESSDFVFDNDYVKTEALNKFNGTAVGEVKTVEGTKSLKYFNNGEAWVWQEKAEENKKAEFTSIVAKEMTFTDFIETVFKPVLGITGAVDVETAYPANTVNVSEKMQAINDIMFAYSTDTGCLNKLYGYFNGIKSNSFVTEFKEAAQEVINAGEGAFKIVATDYGYHIVICTKQVKPGAAYEISEVGKTAFSADLANEESIAGKLKKAKVDANLEKLVSDVVSYQISKFVDEDGEKYAVTKYEKTLKNLISSEAE